MFIFNRPFGAVAAGIGFALVLALIAILAGTAIPLALSSLDQSRTGAGKPG